MEKAGIFLGACLCLFMKNVGRKVSHLVQEQVNELEEEWECWNSPFVNLEEDVFDNVAGPIRESLEDAILS